MKAFDLAFMYVDADLNKTRLLLLIKVRRLYLMCMLLTQQLSGYRPFQCKSTRRGNSARPRASYRSSQSEFPCLWYRGSECS